MFWGLNPSSGKRFFSSPKCPDQLWGLPNFLFSGYCGSFPGVKQAVHEVNHSPRSSVQPTLRGEQMEKKSVNVKEIYLLINNFIEKYN
jgi:hypothetical protein